jgi:hypothetical protein
MSVTAQRIAAMRPEVNERPHLGWGGLMATVAFSTWAMVGMFLDGWAHENLGIPDTFLTPWHAVFYTGFFAMAGWTIWIVRQYRRAGRQGMGAVPWGYDLAIIGLIVFAIGVIGDFLWHSFFGVEVAGERLASPAHFLLFIGGILVISSPLRAAWASRGSTGDAPALKAFLPALLSMTLVTTASSFWFLHLWGLFSAEFLGVEPLQRLLSIVANSEQATRVLLASVQVRVFGSILLTNLLLLTPVLVMLRRWRVPFGSITILFTWTATWMAGLHSWRLWESIPAAFVGGLLADVLVLRLRPWPTNVPAFRMFATVAPLLLWSAYVLIVWIRWGLAVSPELWVGGVFFTAVSGLAQSLAMIPSASKA